MDNKFFYETELKNLGIKFAREHANNQTISISINPKLSTVYIKYFDRSVQKDRSNII